MADSPPNTVHNKLKTPDSGTALQSVVEQSPEEHQSSMAESSREKHSTSVFVNSEPIREDQVENAVKFLAHPKVKGSPVMYRRSFLERKGLTKEEIDEAFRRVPDPTSTVSSTEATLANQGEGYEGKLKTSSSIQPQALIRSTQQASAEVSSTTKVGYLSKFHWSHAVLAAGLLAASGSLTAIFFKKSIIPRLKSWIRKVVLEEEATQEDGVRRNNLKPSLAEETARAAKAAAAAAADVARASQEMMASKSEEKKYFKELTELLNYQVREMKSMTSAIQKLEGPNNASGRPAFSEQDPRKNLQSNSQQFCANGKVDTGAHSVRPLSPPASVEPSGPPHPKSYMEIMEMVKRGERPSNIRDINDQPPNPYQPVPEPALALKPKPWEAGQSQTQTSLIQRGDANFLTSGFQDNHQFNNGGSSTTPWWQHKNTKITEIEPEYEQKYGSSGLLTNNERPAPRSWVPPQPPPVAMAEAAAAIRQPKKSSPHKDVISDVDQLQGGVTEVSDELQMATQIAESGGGSVGEGNGGFTSGDSVNQATLVNDDIVLTALE
ncbi:unnamed protein product [Cuscuta epithymum]|uniref:Peroxisomal membrane protein PEX14 n=2 Tax=Cuscuta epithymum TaxID=186058 RepID=A0AAV0C3G2_9ASTE|nr:unnamed protein product [Cuscuta epithymum]